MTSATVMANIATAPMAEPMAMRRTPGPLSESGSFGIGLELIRVAVGSTLIFEVIVLMIMILGSDTVMFISVGEDLFKVVAILFTVELASLLETYSVNHI